MDNPSLEYINILSNSHENVYKTLSAIIKDECPNHRKEYFYVLKLRNIDWLKNRITV